VQKGRDEKQDKPIKATNVDTIALVFCVIIVKYGATQLRCGHHDHAFSPPTNSRQMPMKDMGQQMYQWADDLFPICRSITGNGVRQTLHYLKKQLPNLRIIEVPSGTRAFDWIIPDEWNITDAFVKDASGQRLIDFKQSNLHVMNYAIPIDTHMDLAALQPHLYSLPEQPNAIPYVTSYYEKRWGFCLTHAQRERLQPGQYHVKIDSTLAPGSLTYGELIIPGQCTQEILLSTYVCHPSMANNELSGPVVTTALAQWLQQQPRRYTYRIVFLVETIGAITYLSRHLAHMQRHTLAGFVLTCLGDTRTYAHIQSKSGQTYADKIAKHVLTHVAKHYTTYDFLARGSDERQYCSPGVDLPVCAITRSKYGTYPEYHTSLDNMSFISAQGLHSSYALYCECLTLLEHNAYYRTTVLCEPQRSRHGLGAMPNIRDIRNLIAYADGVSDLIDIADHIGLYAKDLLPIVRQLVDLQLLERMPEAAL